MQLEETGEPRWKPRQNTTPWDFNVTMSGFAFCDASHRMKAGLIWFTLDTLRTDTVDLVYQMEFFQTYGFCPDPKVLATKDNHYLYFRVFTHIFTLQRLHHCYIYWVFFFFYSCLTFLLKATWQNVCFFLLCEKPCEKTFLQIHFFPSFSSPPVSLLLNGGFMPWYCHIADLRRGQEPLFVEFLSKYNLYI